MVSIKFNVEDRGHKCFGEREGNWVIFRCPVCDDFERRIHLKTGEVKLQIDPTNLHPHNGFFIPVGLDADLYNPN